MPLPSNSAARGSPDGSAAAAPPAAATGDFVINLCASTTPMALAKPTAPELARYTFFVSRRREEGRERFRLHMGYFATREEAEQMLALVRDLYPAAWVGETPGRKLASAARAASTVAAPASAPTPPDIAAAGATPAVDATAAPPAAPLAAAPIRVPAPASQAAAHAAVAPAAAATAPAAPVAARAAVSSAAPGVARPAANAAPAARVAVPAAPTRTDRVAEQASTTQTARSLAAAPAVAATPSPAVAAPAARKSAPRPPVTPASNVREVIAALEPDVDTAASGTVQMPIPPPPVSAATRAAAIAARQAATPSVAAPSAPAARSAPATPAVPAASAARATPARSQPPARTAAPPAAPRAPQAAPARPVVPAVQSTTPSADMTDSQVLRVLEGRASPAQQGRDTAATGIRDIAMLSPQDTQTWRDIKAQIKRDAVVHFAVQLNWSVTPIDLARVPSLAIFNAYTLYKIEGNREGRKWYGLRLGFFSDAVSAKQVAHYVRSEFAQVAVVPVSVNEREQANQIGAIALPSVAPAARASSTAADEFKLIDDEPAPAPVAEAPAAPAVQPEPAAAPVAAAASRPVGASPAARALATTNRRPNRPRGAPQSLEETLEILGASQLSIDNGRGERVVIDGRARSVEPQSSTFSKLLDRLSEKLRK